MKKIYYLTLLFTIITAAAFAQNGRINGIVKTSDGSPAEFVNISLKGTSKAALAEKNGKYEIRNVAPGSYTIVATFIGLEKHELTVNVAASSTANVDFILKESSAQLKEVTISSRNKNKVDAVVAKMPLKNLENPQVYSAVNLETIKQQGITSYDDAFRNIPGINRTWESTGRTGDGASYFALRGFEAQPSLYNGLPGFTAGELDLANVEEIQVLKGPSGTLFGAAFYGFGGVINTVTKKPYFTTGGEITYNTGSFGLNRVAVDVNTPLSKTEKIALRINTSYHNENSFQDAGFKKSFFVAPALTYEVNDKLTFDILAEILELERAVPPIFFHTDRGTPLAHKTVNELGLVNNLSFTSNELTIKNPRFNMQAQMRYKISPSWTSQTVLSRGNVKSDGYYGYIFGNAPGQPSQFLQSITKENSVSSTTDIQQNFNGDFQIGKVRNRVLVGLDYYNRNVVNNGTGYADLRYVTPQGESTYFGANPARTGYPTKGLADSLLANTQPFGSKLANSTYSAYVSDVINFTPAFSAMLSVRADRFVSQGDVNDPNDGYKQTAVSPKFGLVYQPIVDKISVFANYMNAFFNVEPGTNSDGSVKSFKPMKADQIEFGVKTNLFEDRLSATVSYYDIKLKDRTYTDPANFNNTLQGGKVGSKGFEIDINANPATGLNIIAGFSHNESKVLVGDPSGVDFYNEPGRAAGGQGPQDQANLWATYKFTRGSLKDFGFGVGGNYAGVYKVVDNTVTGVFELPSYALLNASAFYNMEKFRVTFNANNILDKQYYIGYWSINPQRPVNFTASFAYKF